MAAIKNTPPMKKQYLTPALDIVSLHSSEIIVTSSKGPQKVDDPADGSMMYGKQRNPIWGDDE